MPSQYDFARACLTAEVFHGSAVRGETRHQVPLSLPRTPLFPDRSAELASGISTASWLSHGHKCGQVFPCTPAFSRAQARSGISPQSCFSRAQAWLIFSPCPCLLTGTSAACIFPCTPAFSRAQARSAPRAHVRELLCETQSSKEQLRRSRTESSAAPPATEELAGEARQVRPARAACGSVSTDFCLLTGGEVWRATGPPAPASIIPARKFRLSSPFLTAHRRSRNFPPRYLSRPSGEVWRATGPPNLSTSISTCRPLPRPYPAGVCQSDTVQTF